MPYIHARRDPELTMRPPADALPPRIAELFRDFDARNEELAKARNELRALDDPNLERDAEKQTRRAHVEAVKQGNVGDTITDYVQELHTRRETLTRTIDALEQVRDEIYYQIHDARCDLAADTNAAHAKQLDTAHATYQRDLGRATASQQKLAAHLAVKAWTQLGAYQPDAFVSESELFEGGRPNQRVSLSKLLQTLASIQIDPTK